MIPSLWRKTVSRPKRLSDDGDVARDKADWLTAEKIYKRHLLEWVSDFPIWVQLGHALKEQDKLAEAEQAYRRALDLDSNDDDLRNHLAHLLKRTGNTVDAARLFVELFGHSGRREPCHELAQLGHLDAIGEASVRARRTVTGDALFIELDDLLGFLEAHKTVSGIQRVQVGIIQHILTLPTSTLKYLFVLNELGGSYLWKLEQSDIGEIIDYLKRPDVDHGALKKLVSKARQGAEAVLPRAGHTYIMLGAFWGYGAVAPRYANMKRSGVAVGVYIYDLIPITHTQYCDDGLPHEFALSLGDGFTVFDFILTISEYSASEVRRYMERLGLPTIPVIAVPLAHANDASSRPDDRRVSIDHPSVEVTGNKSALVYKRGNSNWQLNRLGGRPFAMMVSTIEARKNHGYLVAAWKHFFDEGLDPPDLVFVGRPGWRVTSLMEMLKTTRYLNHHVHIFHDLSDQELTALYDQSLFTLFPSFVEGWGLPVGESLARGKPCIASNTSSIPEVGGDLVDYVDPLNLRHGIEVIRRMAFDSAYRDSRTDEIRTRFRARTWDDVSTDLLRHVRELGSTLKVNTKPETLFPSGRIFRVGDLALGRRLPETYALEPLRTILVNGWYGIETLGCWMKGKHGELEFRSDLPPYTAITIYFNLYAVHFASKGLKLTIRVGGVDKQSGHPPNAGDDPHTATMKVPVNTHFHAIATGKVDGTGIIQVRLTLVGSVKRESDDSMSRKFAIGLASVAYVALDDQAARIRLTERLLLDAQDTTDDIDFVSHHHEDENEDEELVV